MTPSEIERFPRELESKFSTLEIQIMQDIANRINVSGEIYSTTDYKLNVLKELGQSDEYIRKTLAILLRKTDKEIAELFKETAKQDYVRNKSLYTELNKQFTPYTENLELQQLVESITEQTKGEFTNITNSLGFATQCNGKVVNKDLSTYYKETLDKATLDLTSGAYSKEEIIKRTIKEMTNSGLRTIDYASGTSTRINVAVRRALNTTLGQLTSNINLENAKKLETSFFEVSWHSTARPSHQVWQGRVYNEEELKTVCGLGTAGGLCGCNCRHSFAPFIPGISTRTYTDEELDKMNAKENTPRNYKGKDYTSYEATQKMRQLENKMRAQRERIKLLEECGGAKEDILSEKARYRQTSKEYTDFSEKMDLPQQRQRVYEDGLGRVG